MQLQAFISAGVFFREYHQNMAISLDDYHVKKLIKQKWTSSNPHVSTAHHICIWTGWKSLGWRRVMFVDFLVTLWPSL